MTEFTLEKFQRSYPDGIERHYWTLARQRIIFRHLRTILASPADLVLDVGCGRGIAVQSLRGRGVDAIGCDSGTPKPISADIASFLHLGIPAESLPTELAGRVRIVLLLDVLEHLPDPAPFVHGLFKRFNNCRQMLFTVPARTELWSNYDKYYGHTMRYDLPSTRKLAHDCQCTLQYAGYFFHSLWVPARLLRAMGKERSTQIHPPGPAARALHRLIAAGFAFEERIVPKSWIGTSILGILQKNPVI